MSPGRDKHRRFVFKRWWVTRPAHCPEAATERLRASRSGPLSPHSPFLRTPGVLYNQFLSQVDFELLLAHARELGVLVFENSAKRLMVVTPAGHSDVKRFWKRQKHSS